MGETVTLASLRTELQCFADDIQSKIVEDLLFRLASKTPRHPSEVGRRGSFQCLPEKRRTSIDHFQHSGNKESTKESTSSEYVVSPPWHVESNGNVAPATYALVPASSPVMSSDDDEAGANARYFRLAENEVDKEPKNWDVSNGAVVAPEPKHSSIPQTFREWAQPLVLSKNMTIVSCFFLLLTTLNIGVGVHYQAMHWTGTASWAYMLINELSCAFFVFEILLRLCVFSTGFFFWFNNWFDLVLAITQFMELYDDRHAYWTSDPRIFMRLRCWRLLAMLRVVRFVRALRLFDELSLLLDSILISTRSLVWTVILMLLFTYGLGIFFTRLVTDYKTTAKSEAEVGHDLEWYYGSLSRTMLALYEAIAGGISWCELVDPLCTHISPALAVVFSAYVAFISIAMMNVVTASLVDTTIRTTAEQKDMKICRAIFDVFAGSCTNLASDDLHHMSITQEQFEAHIEHPSMMQFLASLDLTAQEAQEANLFQLIDADNSGEVDLDELVRGCLRLKGPAKQFDLLTLLYEHRSFAERAPWKGGNFDGGATAHV